MHILFLYLTSIRCQSIDSPSALLLKRKDLRSLNEKVFHLINDDEFDLALKVIQSERRNNQEVLYSSDLLTWFMSISEKVHLHVSCFQNPVDEKFTPVRFVSIEGLESCRSPSTGSEMDILSDISSSMRRIVDGPIFPTAISSNESIIAISPFSKATHSNNFAHNMLTTLSRQAPGSVWIIEISSKTLLYTIDNAELWTTNHPYIERFFLVGQTKVTALRFSKSGRYLLIAQSSSNNSSIISIWCTSSRCCVGQLLLKDKDVQDVRWNNSDTLISIFYSEDKFFNYFLDWPYVEVLHQPPQLSSWVCGKSTSCALSLSLLDSLVLSEKRDISSDISTYSVDHIFTTQQYFDYLYETEYSWLWSYEIVYCNSLHNQIYNTYTELKQWVRDEFQTWLSSGYSSKNSQSTSTRDLMVSAQNQLSKVCLIVGDPNTGKSHILTKIASQLQDRNVARIWVPRKMLLGSTPNSIAYHMILILSHQLRDSFGESYSNIVLQELSNQLNKKSVSRSIVSHSMHRRHFSTASSSLGSIDLNQIDDDQQDLESLLLFTAITLKSPQDGNSKYFKIPALSSLSIQTLFKCFIEIPLKEMIPPVDHYTVFVDGIDILNSSTTNTHYQVVVHLLTHSTPTWVRVVMTSRQAARFLPYLTDIPTTVINLQEDKNLADDFYLLCNHLLDTKKFHGDLKKGVELVYSTVDLSLKNCTQLCDIIPLDCDELELQRILYSYDPIYLSFQDEFTSSLSEVGLIYNHINS